MVQQARRESTKADDLVRSLTPRPNWQKLDAAIHAATSSPSNPQAHLSTQSALQAELHASTRELADRLATERKQALARVAELEPLEGQLREALMLLEPETQAGPILLQVAPASFPQPAEQQPAAGPPASTSATSSAAKTSQASSSTYAFGAPGTAVNVSEGAASAASTGPSNVVSSDTSAVQYATGLGWNGMPRYLRWEGPVALQPMTLSALQSLLQDVWSAKATYEADGCMQHSLQSFVWRFLRRKHTQQRTVAAAGYNLLYALQQHQASCAMAHMFLAVLDGRWQEAMWHDCRHMLQAVSHILQALSK